MASAQELIQAVLRRRKLHPLRDTVASPSWNAWFGRYQFVNPKWDADSIPHALASRRLAAGARGQADLSRLQLIQALWRTDWSPRSRDERKLHRQGVAATILAHLLIGCLWLWIGFVRIPPPQPVANGDQVVQVEYLGTGTLDQTGGGVPTAATSQTQSPQAPAQAQPQPAPFTAIQQLPQPSQPVPHPQPPAQPLQVTEVTDPDTYFVLPPTTPPELQVHQPRTPTPQIAVQPREIAIETPSTLPQVITEPLRQRPPQPMQPTVQAQIRQREIALEQPVALPQISMPQIAADTPLTPQPSPAQRAVVQREIGLSLPANPSSENQPAPSAVSTQTGVDTATTASNPSTDTTGATVPGTGPKPAAATGAWPEPKRGDDWGIGNRNRPGGAVGKNAGLYGNDGRPNMPAGMAAAGGGFPPGSDNWTRVQIDGNGTWLKRPPLDYRASRFEHYWRPHETLLQEWVRKGIKSMEIPIPGTNKRITCVVSMLQLGGGCGITDPNLNDQEASARPSPQIPFKPELQEDQSGLTSPGKPR